MRHVALALACLLCLPALADDAPWSTDQKGVRVPTRDGQWLSADVYLPPTRGTYPTVLIQTPPLRPRQLCTTQRPEFTGEGVACGSSLPFS